MLHFPLGVPYIWLCTSAWAWKCQINRQIEIGHSDFDLYAVLRMYARFMGEDKSQHNLRKFTLLRTYSIVVGNTTWIPEIEFIYVIRLLVCCCFFSIKYLSQAIYAKKDTDHWTCMHVCVWMDLLKESFKLKRPCVDYYYYHWMSL